MKDQKAKRKRVDLVAIGPAALFSGAEVARMVGLDVELYALEVPTVTDDAKRGRLVEVAMMVDGAWLRQLVAAARSAGWAE